MNKLISIDDSDLDLVSGGGTGADIGSAVGGAVGGVVDHAAGFVGEVAGGLVEGGVKVAKGLIGLLPQVSVSVKFGRWGF